MDKGGRMSWDTKKIFGYFLVCIGLIFIVFALYSVYNVFMNAVKPPETFQLNNLTFSVDLGQDRAPLEITAPLDPEVRKIVNMFEYNIFMLFMLSVGSKVSMLGAQFIRANKEP